MRLMASLALLLSSTAFAQEEGAERRRARDFESDIVREVERGVYLRANVGSTFFFNTHGQTRSNGAALFAGVVSSSIGVGSDVIDRERFSASIEGQFGQSLFNGPRLQELGVGSNIAQGDIHTLSASVAAEVSTYLSRRFGVGVRGGAGVTFIPLLLLESEYVGEIQPRLGGPARLHEGVKPTFMGGPTFEYYTKLSHFSLGVDVDIVYILDLDLGVYPSGYLKYTF
ncbi:MAG: adventurous gliding motility protein CglE [Myxococcales bacterium]|nr:adventurous gliding motility protein CglE [Myxococcales bacterium]